MQVLCSCGKPLDKVPDWLFDVKVEFVCNNCPNRQVRNILAAMEPETPNTARIEGDPPEDDEEIED
ncbi:MAG: hypothetical protein ACK4XJ_08245 [Fimbriimonadaceae bacterium]